MWEQRKWWGRIMLTIEEKSELFYIYYEKWIHIYKEGAIRDVTMRKYEITLLWLKRLVPNLRLSQLNRISYQQLLNDYAEFHERQTTMDFHHQIKAAVLDAVDEGLIDRDPTRKAIIKGRSPRIKKIKYLNQFELHTLLVNLKLTSEINWDWLILIIAKTGMRFSEDGDCPIITSVISDNLYCSQSSVNPGKRNLGTLRFSLLIASPLSFYHTNTTFH